MDSEDDMHDANDVDSLDEDYYSNDTGMDSDNDDDDDAGYEFDNDSDDSLDTSNNHQQKNFSVLKEEDIRQRQADGITRISAVLSVSRDTACMLLRRYKWDINTVHEEWFADEERVRKAVGLLEKPVVKSHNARELACGICFESYPLDSIKTADCGHPFCSTCWTAKTEVSGSKDKKKSSVIKLVERLLLISRFLSSLVSDNAYVSTSINDGPGCLTLKCPTPSCGAAIGIEMVDSLASNEDKEKYHRYLLRSYVEDNKKTKWCPFPGCEHAVEYDAGSGSYDVSCDCAYSFCWNCTEEAHRPVDCDTVAKWILKNSAESENMNWILANSKPCPKCKRPIEKNQGCMHMTCTPPCKFEFCWLCCGAWSDHGERTGGFYACNRYEAAKQEGAYDEAERRREMAKNSLERYTHYYERWATNQSSRQKALNDLAQMQTVHLGKLSEKQCQPETQLKFIVEAWLQIVECRRVLKWTYAYGYYLPEQEQAKRQFFEYLQGEAEAGLERLHQCAEKELQTFLLDSAPEDFNNFRTKLAGLTSVTRNYFENLVRALENGLSDVDSQVQSSKNTSSKNAAGTSKGKGGKGKGSARSGGSSKNVDDSSHWACDQCTYLNSSSSTSCQMCTTRR